MYMVASWACEVIEIFTQKSTEEASFVYLLKIMYTNYPEWGVCVPLPTDLVH